MKNISSILTAGAMGIVLSIGFTGCGANTPQPYNMKIQHFSNITDREKETLLSQNMKEIPIFHPNTRGRYSGTSKIRGNIISYNGLNATFSHKFTIKHATNEIYRTDISRETHGKGTGKDAYGTLTKDYGFSDYINNYQTKLSTKYNNSIKEYSKFKILYNKHKQNSESKLKQINTSFKDSTGTLKNKVLTNFSKNKLYISSTNSVVQLFLNNKSANDFKISNSITLDKIDRYKVNYKQISFQDSYDKFPTNITFEINKVYFNYLPTKYLANDTNIDIEVVNTPLQYGSVKSIKIQNKTKEFIEIDTIAGYYGENVTDNIINIKDMKRVKIAPMSYKIFETGYSYKYRINDYPSKKLLLVDNKNQKINYGFSVGYKMVNQNIIKNVYKVNSYSIKDFQ